MVSEAWQYFKKTQGGAECQIDGCKNAFVKRANGSSTKFLWSHLDHHHKEISKELRSQFGRGMSMKWSRQKNKHTNGDNNNGVTETVEVHCLNPNANGAHLHENVQYEYEHDDLQNLTGDVDDQADNGMRLNLMQLLPSNSNGESDKTDTMIGNAGGDMNSSTNAVNDYFGKMVVAQLNQMDERQAHQTRERIQALIGQVLYASNEPTHFNDSQFNQ
ncbi:hypothetical protein M3Y95_00396700 [Aphelenchoides besseyi]|nr:hypothetical protein M3Y95_00396700 [Aphelenchoides besseyi]